MLLDREQQLIKDGRRKKSSRIFLGIFSEMRFFAKIRVVILDFVGYVEILAKIKVVILDFAGFRVLIVGFRVLKVLRRRF